MGLDITTRSAVSIPDQISERHNWKFRTLKTALVTVNQIDALHIAVTAEVKAGLHTQYHIFESTLWPQ